MNRHLRVSPVIAAILFFAGGLATLLSFRILVANFISQALANGSFARKKKKKKKKSAKQELNVALENSIKKIKKEKVIENKIHNNGIVKPALASVFKNKEFRAKYEKKLAEFEQKKSDMRKKLDEYKSDGIEKWESFKSELGNDLDGIEKSVMNFMDYNKKKVKKLVS